MKNWLRAAAALCAAAALGLAYMLFEAQSVRRVDRRLEAPDAAADLDGLTIVQLSDFHVGFTPSLNLRATRKAVDLALAAAPDLVLISGDFAGGPYGMAELQRQLRRVVAAARLGVYGVLGNHDHGDSKAPFVSQTDAAALEACGVRLLTNETVTAPPRRGRPPDRRRGRLGRRSRRPAGGARRASTAGRASCACCSATTARSCWAPRPATSI